MELCFETQSTYRKIIPLDSGEAHFLQLNGQACRPDTWLADIIVVISNGAVSYLLCYDPLAETRNRRASPMFCLAGASTLSIIILPNSARQLSLPHSTYRRHRGFESFHKFTFKYDGFIHREGNTHYRCSLWNW